MKLKNTIIVLMLLGVLLLSIPKIVHTYHYYFQPFEYIAHTQPIIGTTWELEIFENESKVILLENNGIGLLQLEQLHAPFLLRFEPTNTSRISLHDFEGKLLIVDGEWLSFGSLKTEDFFAKTPFFT